MDLTLADTFAKLRGDGETALLAYLTGGYPDMDGFVRLLHEVAGAGADIIEVGVPFSDPVADGPVIQAASQQALAAGTTLAGLLERLRADRPAVPLVLMSYLNPLIAYGIDRLLGELPRAGICGLIVPDLPVEEAGPLAQQAAAAGVDLVLLAAPTSTDERLRRIGRTSRGFVYAVSVTGTTGVRERAADEAQMLVNRLRAVTDLPVAVGFGIGSPGQVRRLCGVADGVIVGSRIIQAIADGEDVAALVASLKDATRSATDAGRDASRR